MQNHSVMLQDLNFRKNILQHFAPTFFYHHAEENFPVDPSQALKNIITVKREEYLRIQQSSERKLTDIELSELKAINQYFWNQGSNTFNENYKQFQNDTAFLALSQKPSTLLIFDEKHYGYKVGEKIDVLGVAPEGHKKYIKDKKKAPLTASVFATEQGFFIQYEYIYSLNNAIYGTQWLRRLLPERLSKRLGDLGFHYGDAEKVGIHIKLNEDNSLSFISMQTWAHGRDYAQNVAAKDCTFDKDGNVCVYVGVGGHPSYAYNFYGRNLPMDLVGDAYKIRADEIIDVSSDVIEAAKSLADTKNIDEFKQTNPIAQLAIDIPGALSTIKRFADSNPLAYTNIVSETTLNEAFKKYNKYHPWILLIKIKNFFLSLFYKNEKPQPKPFKFETVAAINSIATPSSNQESETKLIPTPNVAHETVNGLSSNSIFNSSKNSSREPSNQDEQSFKL